MLYRSLGLLLIVLLLAACGGAPAATDDAATTDSGAETAAGGRGSDDAYGGSAPAEEEVAAAEEEAAATTEAEVTEEATATPEATADEDAATDDAATTSDPTPTIAATAAPQTEGEVATGDPVRYVIVPDETTVQYAVDETFLSDGIRDFTAIGVTQEVQGEVVFDPANPLESTVGEITIDISTFRSDDERRDNAIRDRWLESATFPIATFTPTNIEGLPEEYTYGDEVTLNITGDLVVRDVTRQTTFTTTGVITPEEMRGTATTQVLMTDFGFDPPDILNVLRAENEVDITFDFIARPQAESAQ